MKKCNKCNVDKEPKDFKVDKRNHDGLQGICKQCNKDWQIQKRKERQAGIGVIVKNEKTCNRCKLTKSIDEFFRDSGFADGHMSLCKECKTKSTLRCRAKKKEEYNAYMRKFRSVSPVKYQSERVRSLRNRYGITQARYDKMLEQQGGTCALCDYKPGKRPLHVDHHHATGKVRGLLCPSHNRSIAILDDKKLLEKSITYISKNFSYGGDGCDVCKGDDEPYMLNDNLWANVTKNTSEEHMCLKCVEMRLGRVLQLNDFTDAPINYGIFKFDCREYIKKAA